MTDATRRYFDLIAARKAYAEGRNVTDALRAQKRLDANTPEIIEAAYDLQAGSYVQYTRDNFGKSELYATELASILSRHAPPGGTLLDIGTGEMTTLSLVMRKLPALPGSIHALDISWSRIQAGLGFAESTMGGTFRRLLPYVAEIAELPLADKSIDITTSSHALEPNGGSLATLMAELFRVTAGRLVLFEPCYEIASGEARQRMERLGYIRDIAGVVARLGGTLHETIPIRHVSNPLNPTACFVISPPPSPGRGRGAGEEVLAVPGSSHPLRRVGEFYFSPDTGLCFPILKSIPILRSRSAILASRLLG